MNGDDPIPVDDETVTEFLPVRTILVRIVAWVASVVALMAVRWWLGFGSDMVPVRYTSLFQMGYDVLLGIMPIAVIVTIVSLARLFWLRRSKPNGLGRT